MSGTPIECEHMETYIARQPILDPARQIQAYELLYRNSNQNRFPLEENSRASESMLEHALIQFGIPWLAAQRDVFINIDREVLLDGSYQDLPPEQVVLELLEHVESDAEVLEACKRLKSLGYRLALDDYTFHPEMDELVQIADIIKVDLREGDAWKDGVKVQQLLNRGKTLLAEKVECRSEFEQACALGYTRFQGFYFSRPQMMHKPELGGNILACTRLLSAVSCHPLDLDHVVEIISSDPTLSYKLLRYLNSAAMRRNQPISDIHRAILLLGDAPLRRWAGLVSLRALNLENREDLLLASLTRASMGESLAQQTPRLADRAPEFFLCGLLSLLDALMDIEMTDLLEQLSLEKEMNAALLGGYGELGQMLRLARAYEDGHWQEMEEAGKILGLEASVCGEAYLKGVRWAESTIAES